MSSIVELIFTILFLAVLVWGGERLLALFPGNEKLKQIVRIVAIVVIALWFLSVAASFFGVSLPWSFGASVHRRH
jgi:hypothetical protein